MTILKIGGVAMPSPTKYDLQLVDVDSEASGRNDSGYLTRDRIRSNIASINVGWNFLTTAQLNDIQNAVSPATFDVEYFIGGSGQYKYAQMYVSDRSISLTSTANDNDPRWDISFSLIEL